MEKTKAETEIESEKKWSRLVRAPLVGAKHVTLDVCTPQGELKRKVVSKGKYAKDYRGVYRAARKCHWGGEWPEILPEQEQKN